MGKKPTNEKQKQIKKNVNAALKPKTIKINPATKTIKASKISSEKSKKSQNKAIIPSKKEKRKEKRKRFLEGFFSEFFFLKSILTKINRN